MFIVFLAMSTLELTKSAVAGDFSNFIKDPGTEGLKFLIVIMVIYILMPMLVRSIAAHWFRWAVVGITVLFTLLWIAHQVHHLVEGDKLFDILQAIDFFHHVLGAWVTVAAVKWARQRYI